MSISSAPWSRHSSDGGWGSSILLFYQSLYPPRHLCLSKSGGYECRMSDLPCILSRIDMRQIWLSWIISSFYQFISMKSGGEEKGCCCQTLRNFPHVLCFLYFLQILIFDSSTESWNPGSMSQDDIKCMTNGQRVAWVKLNSTYSLKKGYEIYQKNWIESNRGLKAWCSIILSITFKSMIFLVNLITFFERISSI